MANPPKEKRNELLVKTKDDNPNMSWTEIGDIFGIEKQTAFKIWDRIKNKH